MTTKFKALAPVKLGNL